MRMRQLSYLLVLALCCGSSRGTAAEAPKTNVTWAAAAPIIDGKLDDAAWKGAAKLVISQSLDGEASAAQSTEVLLLRDSDHLYAAFRCHESAMDKLQIGAVGHDGNVWEDDSMEIFIGPNADEYYHLAVNPAGATYDGRGKDAEWNSGMKAVTGRTTDEWAVELAIPLAAIGGKNAKQLIANFNRNRRTTGSLEESAWSPTYSGDSHVPARFGTLTLGEAPAPKAVGEKPVGEKQGTRVTP